MNQPDTPRPLTADKLNHLLAPVPLAWQQRNALVRIGWRPGLAAGYADPVELSDLWLLLSPRPADRASAYPAGLPRYALDDSTPARRYTGESDGLAHAYIAAA